MFKIISWIHYTLNLRKYLSLFTKYAAYTNILNWNVLHVYLYSMCTCLPYPVYELKHTVVSV